MQRFLLVFICVFLSAHIGVNKCFAEKKGDILLKTIAEVEVEEFNEEGKKEVKRIPASKVVPGDEVIYTNFYTIVGNEPIEDAVINNPVPEHMIYLQGSAKGKGTLITFSVDNGNVYDVPEKLFVLDPDGKKISAKASDYTHIRWQFKKALLKGEKGQVGFRARLK